MSGGFYDVLRGRVEVTPSMRLSRWVVMLHLVRGAVLMRGLVGNAEAPQETRQIRF